MVFFMKAMNQFTIIPLIVIGVIFILLLVVVILFFRKNKNDILSSEKFEIPSSLEEPSDEMIQAKAEKLERILESEVEVKVEKVKLEDPKTLREEAFEFIEEVVPQEEEPVIEEIIQPLNETTISLEELVKEEPKLKKVEPTRDPDDEKEQRDCFSEIAKIQEALEADLAQKNIELTPYEEEQEEKAIISYHELKKLAKEQELDTEPRDTKPVQLSLIREEKIEEPVMRRSVEPIVDPAPKLNPKHFDNKMFRQSLNISPVFGVRPDEPKKKPIQDPSAELEKTLNLNPLTDEIKKNAEFLRALKDLRNNL